MSNTYGVNETNPLPAGYHDEELVGHVYWDCPSLAKVERLRLLSDPGYPWWDVSYCYGRTHKGEKVIVCLPFSQLPKRGMKRAIVREAIAAGVHAKRLGLLDNISTLC